jgi:Uncharacterized protein required for cytochrome oxidase assembly
MYSENNHLNNQLKLWMLSLLILVSLIILVGGLTRLTDSGLSITTWELFVGFFPPFTNEKWLEYFSLYKTIPEYSQQNFNMTLKEFKNNILVGVGTQKGRENNWFNQYYLPLSLFFSKNKG